MYVGLLKLLRLEAHPTFTKPIDPSLYLTRFVDKLNIGEKKKADVSAGTHFSTTTLPCPTSTQSTAASQRIA